MGLCSNGRISRTKGASRKYTTSPMSDGPWQCGYIFHRANLSLWSQRYEHFGNGGKNTYYLLVEMVIVISP